MPEFPHAAQRYAEFRFCPRCGRGYDPADFHAAERLFLCPACGLDFYQNPPPSATVAIAHPGRPDAVLVMKRRTPPGLGLWCVPGGFIRYGETPACAATREAREEVGAELAILAPLCAGLVDYDYRGRRICVVEIAFAARLLGSPDALPASTPEAAEIRFRPAGELIANPALLAFPGQRDVLLACRAAGA